MQTQQHGQQWWTKGWPYLVITVACLIIIAPQLLTHSMILGSDSIFHFNRFYEAAKQIQNHNFSFFQTNYGFQQSGRIINAIYGPLFAYLNGCVLGMVGTWYRYEILSAIVIYWIAGVGMYQLARFVKSKRIVAVGLAIIYMNVGWLPRWETSQNMNAWGAALAPFLGICAVRMLQDHRQPVNSWQLLAIMTVIIQIHMLSSLFFIVTLIPFFIGGLVLADDRRQMWWATIKAGIGTIVLTANVWGALLSVEMTNSIAKPAPFPLEDSVLQLSWQNGSRDYLLSGLLLLFVIQILYIIVHYRDSVTNTVVTAVGTFFLVMSSPLVPWRWIGHLVPVLERFLQFPDRLTVIAYPLLLVGVAITIRQCSLNQKSVYTTVPKGAAVFLLVVACWAQVANMVDIHRTSRSYHTADVIVDQGGVSKHSPHDYMIRFSVHTDHPGQLLLLVEKRSPDYLPVTKHNLSKKYVRSYAYERQIIEHVNEFKHTVLPGGRLQLTWRSNRSGQLRLPIVTYAQSRLVVNGRVVTNYHRSTIGAPTIHQKRGFNKVVMQFVQPWWVTVLITGSLVGIILALLYGFIRLIQWGVKKYNSCYNTNALNVGGHKHE